MLRAHPLEAVRDERQSAVPAQEAVVRKAIYRAPELGWDGRAAEGTPAKTMRKTEEKMLAPLPRVAGKRVAEKNKIWYARVTDTVTNA